MGNKLHMLLYDPKAKRFSGTSFPLLYNESTSIVTRNTTNLKGRKPPPNSCTRVDLYHGSLGSSLAIFFVLHGESNVPAEFLPIIPPMTVSGYPTVNKQKT